MAEMNRRAREIHESVMVGQDSGSETTTRGSSSQQAGMQAVHETTTRGSSEMQQGGGRESMGSSGTSRSGTMGRGSSEYARSLCEREHAMSERERGMSERERGMGDRERALHDRECAMTDRDQEARGGSGEQGSTGSMSPERSRTGGRAGSPGTDR